VAFAVAYVDRKTQTLSPFYLFRPNSLLLLLSLMVGFAWLRQVVGKASGLKITALAIPLVLWAGIPRAIDQVDAALVEPRIPAIPRYREDMRRVVQAILTHTEPDDVVVMQPGRDHTYPWMALERLTGRPTLVVFKFVPTHKADIARWYSLLRWREAVFAGDCARLSEHPADFLLTFETATRQRLADCGSSIWTDGEYGLLRISP